MTDQQTYFKIAISGDLGSGKSTICKLLQEKLSFNIFSMGEAWRRLAAKYKMSILELNKYSETHPLDEEMDRAMAAMADSPQNIIFDSRLAWYFIPHSFKVHLTVDPMIATKRIFNDKRGEAEGYTDITEAYQKLNQRKISENKRYIHKYGIVCSQYHNYDLLVDTSHASPESITLLIIAEFQLWTKGQPFVQYWLSPRTPFPTHDLMSLNQKQIKLISDSIATTGFIEKNTIALLKADGFYYIYDGHNRTSAALLKGINLIPVKIIAQNQEKIPNNGVAREYILKSYSLQNIHQWENRHHFKYPRYPALG
jgi:cytidylate kinase